MIKEIIRFFKFILIEPYDGGVMGLIRLLLSWVLTLFFTIYVFMTIVTVFTIFFGIHNNGYAVVEDKNTVSEYFHKSRYGSLTRHTERCFVTVLIDGDRLDVQVSRGVYDMINIGETVRCYYKRFVVIIKFTYIYKIVKLNEYNNCK